MMRSSRRLGRVRLFSVWLKFCHNYYNQLVVANRQINFPSSSRLLTEFGFKRENLIHMTVKFFFVYIFDCCCNREKQSSRSDLYSASRSTQSVQSDAGRKKSEKFFLLESLLEIAFRWKVFKKTFLQCFSMAFVWIIQSLVYRVKEDLSLVYGRALKNCIRRWFAVPMGVPNLKEFKIASLLWSSYSAGSHSGQIWSHASETFRESQNEKTFRRRSRMKIENC